MCFSTITIKTEKTFTDITDKIQNLVKKVKLNSGLVFITTLHTTCGLKIMENELLSLYDIDKFLNNLIPINTEYAHDKIHLRNVPITERVNGVSHVRMLFFESCLSIPFLDKKLYLGEWQRIFLVEMDNFTPYRERDISVVIR